MTQRRQLDDCVGPEGEIDLALLAWALHLEPEQLGSLAGQPLAIRSAYLLACRIRPWLSSNAETGQWLVGAPMASMGGLSPVEALAAGTGDALLTGAAGAIPEMEVFAPATMALADTRDQRGSGPI